jgi:hypothetical protein
MTPHFTLGPRTAVAVVAAALLLGGGPPADAQGRLKAHYRISMTAVTIGQVAWTVDIGDGVYTTSASGQASGLMSMFVNGDGGVAASGTVENGVPIPSAFTSKIVDEDGRTELRIAFANGIARETIVQGMAAPKDRVPITDQHRRGVTDPLSAVLIPGAIEAGNLAQSNCERVLAIFDGRRRYNLVLSYKRHERVTLATGYSGQALVCGVVLQPLAGYRTDSLLVKYVSDRRDMELWFVPLIGTAVMAPIRIMMPTALGTLKIEADDFTTVARPPAPPPAEMAPNDAPER